MYSLRASRCLYDIGNALVLSLDSIGCTFMCTYLRVYLHRYGRCVN